LNGRFINYLCELINTEEEFDGFMNRNILKILISSLVLLSLFGFVVSTNFVTPNFVSSSSASTPVHYGFVAVSPVRHPDDPASVLT